MCDYACNRRTLIFKNILKATYICKCVSACACICVWHTCVLLYVCEKRREQRWPMSCAFGSHVCLNFALTSGTVNVHQHIRASWGARMGWWRACTDLLGHSLPPICPLLRQPLFLCTCCKLKSHCHSSRPGTLGNGGSQLVKFPPQTQGCRS